MVERLMVRASGLFVFLLISFMLMSGYQKDPGRDLALQYCASCHQFPKPEILTKTSWNFLLTDMGFRLGIVDYQPIASIPPIALKHMTTRERLLDQAALIPGQPLISDDDWQAIRDYYINEAPERPNPQPKKPRIKKSLGQFNLKIPDYQPKGAIITVNRIDENKGGLILNNLREQSIVTLDKNLFVESSYHEPEMMVDLKIKGDSLLMLAIGDLMGSFIGEGRGSLYFKRAGNTNTSGKPVIGGLQRPVDLSIADLNRDGQEEFIVCNFGHDTGNISIYDKQGALVKTLADLPGAVRSQIHDFNDDGKADVAVLMGDARENISLFLNNGDHEYTRKVVVETHSAYGHTYFELQDFNQDGHMDFLVTNGDTDADPFNTLKNYHGVRIYLNDGANNFDLEYFYPMYGAHFAKAADFDQDGDLDIAASAFFPDFSADQPEQFVYLENTGNLKFEAFTHPETFKGRWMLLEVGDYDLDGDQDIVLGGGYHSLGMIVNHRDKFKRLVAEGKALLVFENNLY